MNIRLLSDGYMKNSYLFKDFIEDKIRLDESYFSDDHISIDKVPDFPVYMGKGTEEYKRSEFVKAVKIIREHYIETSRDVHFNGRFWHSLLISSKRDYLMSKYPQIENKKDFYKVVLRKFDWENYIYKCVLAAEYIADADLSGKDEEEKYVHLIYDNLDIFNYIIKYEVFRNSKFLINLLEIIEEENYSSIFKDKIRGRADLGNDERYGRRVIFELNKNYPVILSPFMEKEDLKEQVKLALSLYYNAE